MRKGGGGGSELRFSVLLRPGFFVKCFCSLLGFMSDDYSFVVAFVVYLFNMDIYLYISMYIQAEYRRFGVFKFFLC